MLSHRLGRRLFSTSDSTPRASSTTLFLVLCAFLLATPSGWWERLRQSFSCHALIPLIDGGKTIPKLYNCYFDSQLAKQASTAVGKAIGAGKTRIEVFFSPVYVYFLCLGGAACYAASFTPLRLNQDKQRAPLLSFSHADSAATSTRPLHLYLCPGPTWTKFDLALR